jgi:hypothetical protein
MPTLPVHNDSHLVRAYFAPVSDPAFDGAGWTAVKATVPPNADSASVRFIADRAALASSEYPFLVVDLQCF